MSVNLEYYRAFYYAATLGSMSKAAEALCLTPPTITKTIQALEQQLDCKLFIRTAKGIRLTEAGETILAHVKPGLNLLNAGEHEVSMLNSLESGTVCIGMSEAAASYFTVPALFGAFCSRYPKVRLVIKLLPAKGAKAAILDGDIDFAVQSLHDDDDLDEFHVYKLLRSDNIPVVGQKLKFLADQPIPLEALSEYPLIFAYSGYSIREYYAALYRAHDMDFLPSIETPTLDIQLKAVKMGLGYTFVPEPYIRESLRQKELYRLDIIGGTIYERTVSLLTAKSIPLSRAAQALVDILLEVEDG